MCSGRVGAVSGTGSRFSFRNRFRETGFRPEALFRVQKVCEHEVSKVSVFDGFRGVRFCSRGLDGTGSGNRAEEKKNSSMLGQRKGGN